jgi:hypothetical protein
MNQIMQHPIPTGTKVMVERRNFMNRETILRCEGQLGTSRTWWYQTDAGKRASEYQIVGYSQK